MASLWKVLVLLASPEALELDKSTESVCHDPMLKFNLWKIRVKGFRMLRQRLTPRRAVQRSFVFVNLSGRH